MTNALTALQLSLMNLLAHSEYNSNNGATPTCSSDVNTWLFASEYAAEMSISEKAVGGVITSLTEAGMIGVNIVTAKQRKTGDESGIWFTDAGFDAWLAAQPKKAKKATIKAAKKETRNEGKARRARARRAARKAAAAE